ncbi:hypothetical protein ANN_16939 [Periplaneta americana]|uniref:Uncharacterized protein n=1 Tax=Periplaneta americana TaxID=6978 RepID=A0ABQ8ST05_PERAM|nr:hypothetical protein ANN_16939 [Periplaneta americana]
MGPMAGLCEGGNEPPGSLKVIEFWRLVSSFESCGYKGKIVTVSCIVPVVAQSEERSRAKRRVPDRYPAPEQFFLENYSNLLYRELLPESQLNKTPPNLTPHYSGTPQIDAHSRILHDTRQVNASCPVLHRANQLNQCSSVQILVHVGSKAGNKKCVLMLKQNLQILERFKKALINNNKNAGCQATIEKMRKQMNVAIRRPEFECSGPQLEGPEFECSGPQLEGPEFEYSELSLKVVVITEDVQNVHLLLEYRPHIDVSLTCEHDPKLQEYCICPQNMPQFDSEGIPNQAPETNKPMILNGPTSINREGSDQVSVEAKQLGHLYLSIDQEIFDPSTGEPYD